MFYAAGNARTSHIQSQRKSKQSLLMMTAFNVVEMSTFDKNDQEKVFVLLKFTTKEQKQRIINSLTAYKFAQKLLYAQKSRWFPTI